MLRCWRWKGCLLHVVILSFVNAQFYNPTSTMAQIRDIKSGRSGEPSREPTPRRLAAIVAGDISGYSRLMQIDEEGTNTRVKRIERDLIEPTIREHPGRLV